ncbi:MAG: DUF2177 family protein [Beijerinckiaceae bacterium]
MRLARFAIATTVVFLAADALMIPFVMRPLFKSALGEAMLDELRLLPAALFYVIHIAGLVWFAGRTALRDGVGAAARDGAILGLVAYSCYEMTSHVIMRAWRWDLVVIDTAWGAFLSAAAALAGAIAAGGRPDSGDSSR